VCYWDGGILVLPYSKYFPYHNQKLTLGSMTLSQESGFLRFCLYLLTSFTTLSIFSSALASSHLVPPVDLIPELVDRNIYAKVGG
jgi:hypothetical protein